MPSDSKEIENDKGREDELALGYRAKKWQVLVM
jgi:hypothetical protein